VGLNLGGQVNYKQNLTKKFNLGWSHNKRNIYKFLVVNLLVKKSLVIILIVIVVLILVIFGFIFYNKNQGRNENETLRVQSIQNFITTCNNFNGKVYDFTPTKDENDIPDENAIKVCESLGKEINVLDVALESEGQGVNRVCCGRLFGSSNNLSQ